MSVENKYFAVGPAVDLDAAGPVFADTGEADRTGEGGPFKVT